MIQVYPDKKDEWRWRRKAANNKITADSGEGYDNRGDAIAAARAARVDGEAVVLLRKNGSLVGELNHDESSAAEGQAVDVDPATEKGSA